jgi:hypothetical protein
MKDCGTYGDEDACAGKRSQRVPRRQAELIAWNHHPFQRKTLLSRGHAESTVGLRESLIQSNPNVR